MKINIEKEIYVPSGIYCDKCFEKKNVMDVLIVMDLVAGYMPRMTVLEGL